MADNSLRLNRQQLSQFLPNFEAIKAFEQLFSNVYETLPTSSDAAQATADAALLQSAEALSQLANIAGALSAALYGVYQENAQADVYTPPDELSKTDDFYFPPVQFGTMADQNSNNVNITGGTIQNINKLTVNGEFKANYGVFSSGLAAFDSLTGALYSYYTSGSGYLASYSDNAGTKSVLTLDASQVNVRAAGSQITVTSSTGFAVTGALSATGNLTTAGGSVMLNTTSDLSNNASTNTATLTNGPRVGNPSKWIAINDNGTTRYIPTW